MTMMRRIWVQLSLVLLLLTLFMIMLVFYIVSLKTEEHFTDYVNENIRLRNDRIASALAAAYERDQGWRPDTGLDIASLEVKEGLTLQLYNEKNSLIWSAGPITPNPNVIRMSRSIVLKGKKVGSINLFTSDPRTYTGLDYHFRLALRQAYVYISIGTLLLTLLVSIGLSKKLVAPIVSLTRAAGRMAEGKWDTRLPAFNGNEELSQLVTAFNHLAERLQTQEQLRKQLTADVAHELRTPLATLQAHIEAMMDGVWKLTYERLKDCHEEVVRLSHLVANLEKLTIAENQLDEFKWEKVVLGDLAEHVVQLQAPIFAAKGLELVFAQSGETEIRGEREKLTQILMNLLNNAYKFTKEGSITIRAVGFSNKQVVLTISDTGEGIPEEHVPYLFERFYRADYSRSRETGGAGIGLAIVKGLAEAHGADIKIESKLGEGTSVIITFPAYF